MKYKLLHELPGHKAGEVIDTTAQTVKWYDLSYEITMDLHNPDWFQPIDDTPQRWLPDAGDLFYFVDEQCKVGSGHARRAFIERLNCFRTEQQAQTAAEAIRAVLAYVQSPLTREPSELSNKAVMAMSEAHVVVQKGRD